MFLTANTSLAFRIYAQNEFRNLGERGILSYLCKALHCNSALTTFISLSENWLWTPVSRKKHESIPPPRSIVWKLAIKWQKLNLWHTVPRESISSLYSLQSHLWPITIVCIIFYLGRKVPIPLFPTLASLSEQLFNLLQRWSMCQVSCAKKWMHRSLQKLYIFSLTWAQRHVKSL